MRSASRPAACAAGQRGAAASRRQRAAIPAPISAAPRDPHGPQGSGAGDAAWIIDPDTGALRELPMPDPDKDDIMPCSVPSRDFVATCVRRVRKDGPEPERHRAVLHVAGVMVAQGQPDRLLVAAEL